MTERNVIVYVPMKASEVELTRTLMARAAEFPTVVWNYADKIERLLLGDDADAGKELAQLVVGMKADAEKAENARRSLAPFFARAEISDPETRKGGLQ